VGKTVYWDRREKKKSKGENPLSGPAGVGRGGNRCSTLKKSTGGTNPREAKAKGRTKRKGGDGKRIHSAKEGGGGEGSSRTGNTFGRKK